MPNVKKSPSVEKAARSAEVKRQRNRSVRSALKTSITKTEKLVSSKASGSREAVTATASALDKAVTKGVIHRNKAARHKSHLAKKLNKTAS